MKPCPPLIPRRKKRAKDEPTQSDVFVADKQGTQYHTPRVSADSAVEEDEKPVQVELVPDEGSADSAFQQDEVKAPIPSVRPLGSPKREVITSSQLSPQEGVRFIEPETEETKVCLWPVVQWLQPNREHGIEQHIISISVHLPSL